MKTLFRKKYISCPSPWNEDCLLYWKPDNQKGYHPILPIKYAENMTNQLQIVQSKAKKKER